MYDACSTESVFILRKKKGEKKGKKHTGTKTATCKHISNYSAIINGIIIVGEPRS